jgi:hypothetical protein
MSAYLDCPPFDPCGPCGTLPGGFVRLRFFYGKRMGVADFVDEQRYHAGKMRFHNQRMHGAGLLCGLAVSRMSPTDLFLRVGKGAAIDSCGREIVIGHDQCIDLDAWFQRELIERRVTDATWPAAALDAAGNLPLVVAVRYRDCPTGPEPAPRDTCSCDAAGCDFGRVREEFELDLFAAVDPEVTGTLPMTPARADVEHIVGRGPGGSAIARSLAAAATISCAEPDAEGWLRLAAFTAIITTAATEQHLTAITPIVGQASLLQQTALLQDLMARELAAQLEAGALNDGPEVTALRIDVSGSPTIKFFLDLGGPLIEQTVPVDAFTLTRLVTSGAGTGWHAITCHTAYVAPTSTTLAALRINVASSDLIADQLYRLALDPSKVPPATPIVDDKMRPLRPLRGVFQFGLAQPAGALVIVDPPYAT